MCHTLWDEIYYLSGLGCFLMTQTKLKKKSHMDERDTFASSHSNDSSLGGGVGGAPLDSWISPAAPCFAKKSA